MWEKGWGLNSYLSDSGGGILGGYRGDLEGSGRDLGGLGEYWERIYE